MAESYFSYPVAFMAEDGLSPTEKAYLAWIRSLANLGENGDACQAGNAFFAEAAEKRENTPSRHINALRRKGYIAVDYEGLREGGQKRWIRLTPKAERLFPSFNGDAESRSHDPPDADRSNGTDPGGEDDAPNGRDAVDEAVARAKGEDDGDPDGEPAGVAAGDEADEFDIDYDNLPF